jgi:hypothetical protein
MARLSGALALLDQTNGTGCEPHPWHLRILFEHHPDVGETIE